MDQSITNLLSHSVAAIAFVGLLVLLIISRQPGRIGNSLLVACVFSILWALFAMQPYRNVALTGIIETGRILAWAFFLHTLIHPSAIDSRNCSDINQDLTRLHRDIPNLPWLILFLVLLQLTISFMILRVFEGPAFLIVLLPAVWIGSAITGLAYLEKLYRGTESEKRRALKPLCIGLTGMFLLDFFVFTDTLLFRRIDTDLWQVRGLFYAFLVPIIALSVARNPAWAVRIHVSRQAVSSSITVMGAGTYLLATAVAAHLIRLSDAEWANVAQIAFILISLIVLTSILISSRLRAQLRVNVSKHLFNFKYDYRNEWLNFTRALSTDIDNAPRAILQGFKQILKSNGGSLWAKSADNDWELLASSDLIVNIPEYSEKWESLEMFLRKTGWIVQMDEFKAYPDRYQDLQLPKDLQDSSEAWLIIPLPDLDDIVGFVIIDRSPVIQSIAWEDRDLLKTAGQQAAGLLVQRRSHEALMQARQFEAFSKLSAYVIHDLKNILGQQSLIVSNAAKHKHKPAFIDDVILTVENSVSRMQTLLEKLQEQQSEEDQTSVDVSVALNAALKLRCHALPTPNFSQAETSAWVAADADKLVRVLGHLIHNAQDATHDQGNIEIIVSTQASTATVTIVDDGVGMTPEFIKDGLFKPFVSSKGLTGMGVGAYESREYIRKLGGKVAVSSKVGKGTMFTVTIPTIVKQ